MAREHRCRVIYRSYLRCMVHGPVPHHHHMHHAHDHVHPAGARALRGAFFINLTFTLVEVAGGWWTDSIAVLTDALHDAGDCLVLGTAWYLQRVAMRGRDAQYSYGYGRYSMLGGWLTSGVLVVGALFILTVSVPRLLAPQAPHSGGMIALALFGLVMNGLAAWWLHGGRTLNERGAYLHLLEDVLGWAAVLLGGIVIHVTGWIVLDPLLSIAISAYILANALRTLRKGTGILMQEIPAGLDMQEVRTQLMDIPNVMDLHDQHTWTLDGRYMVPTGHNVDGDVSLQAGVSI